MYVLILFDHIASVHSYVVWLVCLNMDHFKGVLHLLPKISMCFALSQIVNTFLKNNIWSYSKLSQKLKNGIEILVGQAVF